MILFPNAKINLGLDIERRRPDGYHDIVTVMYPVGWSDVLELVPGKGEDTTLTVTGNAVDCPPEKNLVMKAYRALDAELQLPPVDIFLHKIIPDGAGLGGGSADAAFTLTGLNELFDLGLEKEHLAEIAGKIGADCSFFVYDRPMLCTGTGTTMAPIDIDLSDYAVAIVKPPFSVPTREAYSSVTPAVAERSITEILTKPVEEWRGELKNDFERTVGALHPEIHAIRDRLYKCGAVYAAMSGSGSAVFGLFKNDILADDLKRLFPACATFAGHL
ncbi:MAG: 4-(cytidine 5'-diphospho)-2-C-methyl-D-erythritol kinase [Duncaniella sp.]|nr:4-(cytidine 5'-diphospho)-2-C-methyl-D-erythritol kinase [Duncaniella sp.]